MNISPRLLFAFFLMFIPSQLLASDRADFYYFLKNHIMSQEHVNWTDIFYAGMKTQSEARDVCAGDSDEYGFGFECVVGFYSNKTGEPKSEDLGAPLTSCATIGFTNVQTAMGLNHGTDLVSGKVPKDIALKFNALFLGFAILEIQDALTFYGVPKSSWSKPLRRFEKKLVKRLKRKPRRFLAKTFSEMNKLSKRINRNTNDKFRLRPIMGCGGGLFPVEISVEPQDASLEIIPKMFYDFCISKNIPFDSPDCKKHFIQNIQDREEVYLSGVYMYRLIINGKRTEFRYKDTSRDILPVIRKMNNNATRILSDPANAVEEGTDDIFDGVDGFVVSFN